MNDLLNNYKKAWEKLEVLPFSESNFIRASFIEYGKAYTKNDKVKSEKYKDKVFYKHDDLVNIWFESESQAIFAASLRKFLPKETDERIFTQILSIIMKLGNVESEYSFNTGLKE
jgi:GTP-binding protein EngB required for normal cell division